MFENYASLVQWIAEDARDPTLGHALLRDVRMGKRRSISRVIPNVNTHKQPGNMGLRIIHSSPGLCIRPAMRWNSEHIRQFFSDKPHLRHDTDDLLYKAYSQWLFPILQSCCALISATTLCQEVMLRSQIWRPDVFHNISRLVPELSFSVSFLNKLLLSMAVNRRGKFGKEPVWDFHVQVKCPTWRFTSSLRSTSLWIQKSVRNTTSFFHSRFKDDALYIVDSRRELHLQFMEQLKAKAGVYGIDFESISYETVDMLDVALFKGRKWRLTGRLDHSPYVIPSSQWRPLLCSSYHAPAVHLAWPVGMVK